MNDSFNQGKFLSLTACYYKSVVTSNWTTLIQLKKLLFNKLCVYLGWTKPVNLLVTTQSNFLSRSDDPLFTVDPQSAAGRALTHPSGLQHEDRQLSN